MLLSACAQHYVYRLIKLKAKICKGMFIREKHVCLDNLTVHKYMKNNMLRVHLR